MSFVRCTSLLKVVVVVTLRLLPFSSRLIVYFDRIPFNCLTFSVYSTFLVYPRGILYPDVTSPTVLFTFPVTATYVVTILESLNSTRRPPVYRVWVTLDLGSGKHVTVCGRSPGEGDLHVGLMNPRLMCVVKCASQKTGKPTEEYESVRLKTLCLSTFSTLK